MLSCLVRSSHLPSFDLISPSFFLFSFIYLSTFSPIRPDVHLLPLSPSSFLPSPYFAAPLRPDINLARRVVLPLSAALCSWYYRERAERSEIMYASSPGEIEYTLQSFASVYLSSNSSHILSFSSPLSFILSSPKYQTLSTIAPKP